MTITRKLATITAAAALAFTLGACNDTAPADPAPTSTCTYSLESSNCEVEALKFDKPWAEMSEAERRDATEKINEAVAKDAAGFDKYLAENPQTVEGAVDPVEGIPVTPAGNPVDILRKIDGCSIPAGVTDGQPWEGTREAECQFLDDDIVDASVTVTTIPAEFDARLEYPDRMPAVDSDIETVIVGRGFMLTVVDTTMSTVDVRAVAAAVDGEIVTAESFRAFMLADGNGTGN